MDSGSESPTTPSLDWIESAVHSPLEGNPLHDLDDETLTVEGVKGLLIRGAIHDMPAAMSNNFRNLGLERLRKLLAPIMMRWLWKRIVQRTRERKVGFQKPEHVVREELGMRRLALDALAAEGTLTEVWPADVKERLVQSCGYLKHRRDEEIIVHEGESGISGVFVLVSGKVDLAQRKRMPPRRNSATITREVFESKQAPRLFGDWLAMTNDTHPCSVISRGDTGWWVLPKEDLVRFIHSPEFPASARREIAATLRQRQMARFLARDAITTQSESASGLVILVKGKARRELYGDTATFGDRNQPVYELDGLQCLQASPGRWGTVLTAETICDAWFIPRATAVSIITSHHGDAIQQRIAQASLMRKLSFHSQSRHRLSSGSPLHTSWCSSMDPNSPRVVHSPILSSTNDPPFEGAPLDCRRNSTRNSFRNLARQRKQSTQSLAAHPGVNRRSSYGSPAGSPVLHSTSRPLPTFDSISSPCHAYQMRSPSLVSYHAANSSNLDPGPAAGDAGEAFVALKRGSSISICANLPKRLSPSFGSPSFGSPSFGSPSFGHDTEYLALSPRTAQKGLAVTFAATERTEEPDSTYNKQSQLISNVRRSSSFVERVAVMLQGQGSTEGDKLQNRLNAIVSKTEGMPKVNPPAALISPRRALEADEMHRYATRRVLDVRLVVAEPFVKKADRVNEEKRRRQRRRRKKKMRDASSQSTEEAEEEKEMDETCGSASAAEAASDASSTASSTLIDVLDEEEALLLFPFDSDTAPHGAQTSQHRLTSPANSSHSTRVKAYNTPSRPAPGRPHPGTPKSANLLTGSQHRPTNRTPGGRPIGSSILIPSTVALEDAFQPQPASSKPSLASPSTGSAHRHIREARQLAQGSGNGPHSPPQAVTRPRSRGGRKTTSEAPRIASPARAHPRVQSSSARAARPEVCREESFEQAAISGVSRADDFEGTRDRLEQGTGAEPPVDGNGTATEVLGSTGVFSKAASDRKHAGTSQARSGSRGLTGACRQQHRQPKSSRSGPSQPILHPHLLGFQYGRSITPEGMAGAVGLCSPPLYSHANELTSPVSDIPATGYATLLAESCTPSPSASRDSASLQRFPQGVTLDDLLGRTVFDTNGPTLFAATCEASEQVTIQVVPNLSFKPDSLARWRPLQLSFPVSLSKKSQLKLRIAAAFAASNHRDKTPVTVQSLLKVHQGKPATLVLRELRDGDVILATFGKRQKRGRKRAPFDMIAGATV
eukprot:gene17224-26446_t